MKGIHVDYIKKLKEEKLYDYFIWLAEASCKETGFTLIIERMQLSEAIDIIKEQDSTKSRALIERNIRMLIHRGLLQYADQEIEYIYNFTDDIHMQDLQMEYEQSLYEFEEHITDETQIQLTNSATISGEALYMDILSDEREKAIGHQLESAFKKEIDGNVAEYREYVDVTKKELENKISEIENGTIKSIEIMSIFSAIISILVINAESISKLAEQGIATILLINTSVVVCIFFLLLFTRIIICKKNNWRDILKWIFAIFAFLLMMLILIA